MEQLLISNNRDNTNRIEYLQSGPPPDYTVPFAEYSYNENSQISQTKYNNNSYNITNTYSSRNWLTQSTSSNGMFEFTLGYLSNGNINTQYLTGSYRSNFPDIKEIKSLYSYDKSNRLKKTEKYSTKYYDLAGEYSFDPDGNFLTHTRS